MATTTHVTQHSSRVVLARRANGGIRVALLWAAETNAVAVQVRDDRTGDRFELVVEREVNPVDVFEHPYAYAAWRGVEYREAA